MRELLDCCLARRRPDGLFGNLFDDPDSFSESTAVAMLTYSALRAATEGWLPDRYSEIGSSPLDSMAGRLDNPRQPDGSVVGS